MTGATAAGDLWVWLYVQPLAACRASVVGSLIKAGAFDYMGHTRHALWEVHEQVVDAIVWLKRSDETVDLFAEKDPVLEACLRDRC